MPAEAVQDRAQQERPGERLMMAGAAGMCRSELRTRVRPDRSVCERVSPGRRRAVAALPAVAHGTTASSASKPRCVNECQNNVRTGTQCRAYCAAPKPEALEGEGGGG